VLDLAPELAATLARWGISMLGELAELPREGLATRLGAAGLRAHDIAWGRDHEPFEVYVPPPYWEEAQGFEWEIESLGALGVVLQGVLERLCARLRAAHVCADTIDLHLQLASGECAARTVQLASPTWEAEPILMLARLEVEARPPEAPVTGVAVRVHPVPHRPGQGGLWQPSAPTLRDLAVVLTRLTALVGLEGVGSPRPLDTHRPDAFTLVPFDVPGVADTPARRRERASGGWRGGEPPSRAGGPHTGPQCELRGLPRGEQRHRDRRGERGSPPRQDPPAPDAGPDRRHRLAA